MAHLAQIRYDEAQDRMILAGEELHCGQCLEVLVASVDDTGAAVQEWKSTRLEMGVDWYLVGLQDLQVSGLFARAD